MDQPEPKYQDGVMDFKGKKVRVMSAIEGEQEGRRGWFAFDAWAVETNLGMQETKMFYPADMFTFTPAEEDGNSYGH